MHKYNNDHLGTYENKHDAMDEAHKYLLPVMRGVSNSMEISRIINILDT